MSKTIYLIAKHPKMVILGVCIKRNIKFRILQAKDGFLIYR